MSRTKLDSLFQIDSPWVYVGTGEAERKKWNPSHFYSRPDHDVCVRRLRGQKMRSTAELMNEFAAALQFFDGFGENWYALEECLSYLDEWMPAEAYVLIVDHAEELLDVEQQDHLAALLKTVDAAGAFWSKPVTDNGRFNRRAIPFHMLLILSKPACVSEGRIIKAADDAHVTLGHYDSPLG